MRLLCPNCHSQTNTYVGKNIKSRPFYVTSEKLSKEFVVKKPIAEPRYCYCGISISKKNKSGLCRRCSQKQKVHETKIQWPTKEELNKLIWEKPTMQIAKELGVSDNAVAKKCKKYELTKPPRGYWAKMKHTTIPPISKEELERLVWKESLGSLSMRLGVGRSTISSWCKKYNIERPSNPYQYWNKKENRIITFH